MIGIPASSAVVKGKLLQSHASHEVMVLTFIDGSNQAPIPRMDRPLFNLPSLLPFYAVPRPRLLIPVQFRPEREVERRDEENPVKTKLSLRIRE